MIEVKDKQNCCGCSACVQKCPKHCISMEEDEEGFFYPKVDKEVCIDCGICEDVCPFANISEPVFPISVLAAKNRNEEDRMRSSSGGVFISLAQEVIKEGGVVFGVTLNTSWGGVFSFAETIEDVHPMMGSKYLQAEVGNAYREAEIFLKEGRKVLFTGCPCQIAGLHRFLKKEYDNLISVDCLCHGVPSPGVWHRYLDETFSISARRAAAGKNTVLPSSLNMMPVISGIEFRDKTISGWKKYSFVVRGMSASKADKNSVLLSTNFCNSPFMKGFLSDIYLRPSCYACKCKNGRSHSDITIGDFWGIGNVMPEFDDDKGVSLILINTPKGQDYYNRLDMEARAAMLEDAIRQNGGFKEHIKEHPQRELFFKLYNTGTPVKEAVDACLYQPIHIRAIKTIKVHLKNITKKALGKDNVEKLKKVIR